ncbi:MAG: hypothetical protein JWN04_1282 [Myxococcaceae bacterium]|nr:hypothetical protein [Myxococcaceae bacterium]
MLTTSRKSLLVGSAVLLASSTAYAMISMDATEGGWQPLVTLWGKGDKSAAVKELHRITNAFDLALHHMQIDDATQEFTDGTIEDLEDFDLGDFHARLPNQSGDYRELWVRGEIKGKNYVIGQAKEKKGFAVTLKGERNELAAMSTTVRSKETKGYGDTSAFFIGYRFGLGIGNFGWETSMIALQDWARLNMEGHPTSGDAEVIKPTAAAKTKTKSLHPKIGPEDLDPLAVLFDAYPSLATALSRLGSIDDLRTVWAKKNYQQVSLTMHADVERFGEHYPSFAKYADKLNDLALMDIKWLDSKGRTLMQYKIDSDKLSFSWQCYVKDGKLLPFKGVKVFENEPVDPMSDELTTTSFLSDIRLKMLGVVIKLTGLKLDAFYQPHPGYMESGLTFTQVPKIQVEGAALGFVPTAMVDAFIPGNIESVTRDFLNVAAKGNGGKGFVGVLKLGIAKDGSTKGVLETGVDFDALDNFLVKIGLGMVSDKLIPDADAFKDIKQVSTDVYDGFVKDLARFESHGATASNAH